MSSDETETQEEESASSFGRVFGNASFLLAARLISMGLVFASGVITARIYSPTIRGEYAMLTTVAAFAMTLLNMGTGEGLIHFLNKGEADVRRTVTVGFGISGLVLLIGITTAWLVSPTLAEAYFPESGTMGAALGILAGALAVLHRNAYSIWIARIRFGLAGASITAQSILFFAFLAWAWFDTPSLVDVALAYAATWGLAALLVAFPLLRHIDPRTITRDFLGRFVGFISKSALSVIFTLLNYRLDMFFVGALAEDLSTVAYYHVATMISSLIWLLPDSLGPAIFPSLSGANSLEERTELTANALRHIIYWVTAAALGVAIVSPLLVLLAFGEDYAPAIVGVWVLLPGVIAMSIVKVIMRFLMSIERHGITVVLSALGAAICVGGDILLVPQYGVTGAAAASTVAYTFVAIGMVTAFLRLGSQTPGLFAEFPLRETRTYRDGIARSLRRR